MYLDVLHGDSLLSYLQLEQDAITITSPFLVNM